MSQRNSRIHETATTKKEMSDIRNAYCNGYTSVVVTHRAIRRSKSENYKKYSMKNEVKRSGEHDRFMQLVSHEAAKMNIVFSANGATEYATTGSALTDFNARATEFRNAERSVIEDAAVKAYAENPVNFVKLLFQTGDIRGGKGERHAFNTCMDWLVATHPMVAVEVLALIPEYTRWDYLVRHITANQQEISVCATTLVVNQFHKDLDAVRTASEGKSVTISLLAKWMPSLQTKKNSDKVLVRHLLKALHMQEREYRKALSELRNQLNIIEKSMSAKEYDAIDMEKLSSKQQLRYEKFFKRMMAAKRHEYIQAVLRGEKKMNASVLNPLDIFHEYEKDVCKNVDYNEDCEALWSLIPDKTSGNGNTLVIRDGSFSMTSPIGQGSSATMLEAASAMAIYCAEHMTGAFRNTFITFSSRPKIVQLAGCMTLADKINLLHRYNDCSNTDIEATFDLILNTAVKNDLSQDELPAYLMILSDMEFDVARGAYSWYGEREVSNRDTLFSTIREKWDNAGYEMPTLVFWQLNGARTIYPEIDSRNGIIFLSGFSTNELELVMAGKYEAIEEVEEEVQVVDELTGETKTEVHTYTKRVVLTPKEQLELELSNPRYDAVEEAVCRGLEKEAA